MKRDHWIIVLASLASLASLAGCQRLNPAFLEGSTSEIDGDGDGDSDGEGSSETDTDEPETDTEQTGDGDEQTGDGDGEPGCFVEPLVPGGDTFFQSGPSGPNDCRLGWGGPWVAGNCEELNFGETPVHWVGLGSDDLNDSEGESYYALRLPDVDFPPDYELVGLSVVIYVNLLEFAAPNSLLRLQRIGAGEGSSWYAGQLDATVAASGTSASTYGYRIPEDAAWPDMAFHSALAETVVEVGIDGVQGLQGIEFPFGPGVVADLALNPEKYGNGFALTSVGLAGFDVLVSSLEAAGGDSPFFLAEFCPP